MEYFVSSNINHDGKAFSRGDTIELLDEFAKPLMEAGAIQTEPLGEQPATPVAPVKEEKEEAKVGGSKQETGEPSIDGPATSPEARKEATDVTPPVDQSNSTGGGILGRMFGGTGDPSANL